MSTQRANNAPLFKLEPLEEGYLFIRIVSGKAPEFVVTGVVLELSY